MTWIPDVMILDINVPYINNLMRQQLFGQQLFVGDNGSLDVVECMFSSSHPHQTIPEHLKDAWLDLGYNAVLGGGNYALDFWLFQSGENLSLSEHIPARGLCFRTAPFIVEIGQIPEIVETPRLPIEFLGKISPIFRSIQPGIHIRDLFLGKMDSLFLYRTLTIRNDKTSVTGPIIGFVPGAFNDVRIDTVHLQGAYARFITSGQLFRGAHIGHVIMDNVDFVNPSTFASSSIEQLSFPPVRTIPDVSGTGIKSIGAYAFSNVLFLKSVAIPTTVTVLEARAFGGCVDLCEVLFVPGGDSDLCISYEAFAGDPYVLNLSLPQRVTHILNRSFPSVENLTFRGLSRIGIIQPEAFDGNKLRQVSGTQYALAFFRSQIQTDKRTQFIINPDIPEDVETNSGTESVLRLIEGASE
jgi:hypothetical protein